MSDGIEIEVKDLRAHVKRWSEAHWRWSALPALTDDRSALMQVAKGFQRAIMRATPVYEGELQKAITVHRTKEGKHTVIKIGPRATHEPVKEYDMVIEAGRRRGKMPPYGPQSKLLAWAIYRGFPPSMVYRMAAIMAIKGSPSKANPRYRRGYGLSYMTYVWRNRRESILNLQSAGVEVVRRFLK